MKRPAALVLLGLIVIVPLRADDDEPFPPTAIPPDRYDSILKRSPFVLPTIEEPTVAATWTSDYQIVSVLKNGEELVVLAKQLSTGERIAIRAKKNAQGIRLLKLNLSPNPREVSAVIELNGEEGMIQYDPDILSSFPNPSATDNPALKSE